jgi:ornithine cyclodeaminase
MLIITADEVEATLPMRAAIDAMRQAMIQVSTRQVLIPMRQFLDIPHVAGKLVTMPGYLADPPLFGVKTVAKYVREPGSRLGSHVGTVQIFDATSGILLAIIEGGSLTAIRTAAASALATDILARPDATRLAILGTGEQARRHIAAIAAIRPIEQVTIWGRSADKAQRLADHLSIPAQIAPTVDAAIADADIICTTTGSADPILFGANLQPGIHVNLVGSAIPTTAEADIELVRRSEFYVDYRDAALAQAGELRAAISAGVVDADHIRGEIGDVLLNMAPGRSTAQAITVYKSLGIIAQDLAAADVVMRAAHAAGFGQNITLDPHAG